MNNSTSPAQVASSLQAPVGRSESERAWNALRSAVLLKPRHRWFSAPDKRQPDEWFGPHKTIEAAVLEQLAEGLGEDCPVYVAQGRKLTKAEIEDMGVNYTWEVDSQNALTVIAPNAPREVRETR